MPSDEIVAMDDEIRGHIEVNTSTLDDKVLWKRADELPTYHLANIVDDHLMEITDVIRGEEWLPSLPLHYLLYRAFGWERPNFAHLPLLLKPVGNGKLSKRDGDKMGFPVFPLQWTAPDGQVSRGYREDGYFPDAFVNLLAMLGWNPGTEQELFSLDELVQAFSLEKVGKSGAKFNPEKAKWFNKEYLRMRSDEELAALWMPSLRERGIQASEEFVRDVVTLIKERATFVNDFWNIAWYLFVAPESYVEKDSAKFWKAENVAMAREALQASSSAEEMENYIREKEWPMGKVMNCIRLALTGSSNGLGIADIMRFIGREEALARFRRAEERLLF
jgi:glutamyl-tRNA synthetase